MAHSALENTCSSPQFFSRYQGKEKQCKRRVSFGPCKPEENDNPTPRLKISSLLFQAAVNHLRLWHCSG